MKCPFCGSSQVMIVNSRPNTSGSKVWRRRKCLKCLKSFTTYENISLSYLIVVKKSGRRQRYSRAKLFASIYGSFLDKKGVDRGDASSFSEEIADRVEKTILKKRLKEISTGEILDIILSSLVRSAPDSFLRYLAYRKGKDKLVLKRFVKKYFSL
jgi:transcriptional repressor NrdR